ncbi:MAG TPA: Asp23/Gls24 family envelope stress response protein [Candidatus Limnocylindrales bacterium]|nr:Asp23/Gls24 family envelope stress response protein [Candidatus Limnocylindrales bacterium]
MPTNPTPGRSLVTRRAVVDVVRVATLGSYGVTGFAGGWIGRLGERLGLGQPGIEVTFGPQPDDPLTKPELQVDLDITVAYGLPIAEVARQVDSAVRYSLRNALGRDVTRLTIHVDGLRYQPGDLPATPQQDPNAVTTDDLAASGTDVA